MFRIGTGYDSHRFEEGGRLVLGGVEIPHTHGLKGHSDADALIHAIIDALFGAAALGDIGSHFPDTDPAYKGADSAKLLAVAAEELRRKSFVVCNIDATVICERPKLAPHIAAMRQRLADIIGINVSQVSVKGKTNEKIDATGRCEGIVVHAVALVASA